MKVLSYIMAIMPMAILAVASPMDEIDSSVSDLLKGTTRCNTAGYEIGNGRKGSSNHANQAIDHLARTPRCIIPARSLTRIACHGKTGVYVYSKQTQDVLLACKYFADRVDEMVGYCCRGDGALCDDRNRGVEMRGVMTDGRFDIIIAGADC